MRFFWFASIFIFCAIFSCKPKATVQNPGNQEKFEDKEIAVLWKNDKTDSTFKFITKANVYGREIKGILFIKRISDSLYKTSFLAQGALKLFEIDLMPDTFIVHERSKQIDKPIVLKTLANDLQLITFESHKTLKKARVTEVNNLLTYQVLHNKSIFYYSVNQVGEWQQVVVVGNNGEKISTGIYDKYENGIPQHFNLKHHKFRLEIDMDLMKE